MDTLRRVDNLLATDKLFSTCLLSIHSYLRRRTTSEQWTKPLSPTCSMFIFRLYSSWSNVFVNCQVEPSLTFPTYVVGLHPQHGLLQHLVCVCLSAWPFSDALGIEYCLSTQNNIMCVSLYAEGLLL